LQSATGLINVASDVNIQVLVLLVLNFLHCFCVSLKPSKPNKADEKAQGRQSLCVQSLLVRLLLAFHDGKQKMFISLPDRTFQVVDWICEDRLK